MNLARFIDHLPPLCAWLALAATGYFGSAEVTFFVAPLVAALLVEWKGWELGAWRRPLEIGALLVVIAQGVSGAGLLPTTATAIFLVAGIRLCLPRGPRERAQILLTSFLALLATAILGTELSFAFSCLAWFASALALLLRQVWEQGALHHRGMPVGAPFRRIPFWVLGAVSLGLIIFLVLPRISVGFRPAFVGLGRSLTGRAGLSDQLDLGQKGAIQPSNEVVMRVQPRVPLDAEGRAQWADALGLWKGMLLEGLEGQRWVTLPETQVRQVRSFRTPAERQQAGLKVEVQVAPTFMALLPRPYGSVAVAAPNESLPQFGLGGSLRWRTPPRVTQTLWMSVRTETLEHESPLSPIRRSTLTQGGDATQSALAWSQRIAPGTQPPLVLAARLSEALQKFRYTLDNPSGRARNPLQDFLERSQAGHCEYFASALAIMLRLRGVPARVVNGYRLGPWIDSGGYWLITENEAHSWVECFDETQDRWVPLDPTPAAPPSPLGGPGFGAAIQRWLDALNFRWDRHVVRFDLKQQIAGLDWLQEHGEAVASWRPRWPSLRSALPAILSVGVGLGLLYVLWRLRHRYPNLSNAQGIGQIPELRPLLRAVRETHPPQAGETLRLWLQRLAEARADLTEALDLLTTQAEARTYGVGFNPDLRHQARDLARRWRRKP